MKHLLVIATVLLGCLSVMGQGLVFQRQLFELPSALYELQIGDATGDKQDDILLNNRVVLRHPDDGVTDPWIGFELPSLQRAVGVAIESDSLPGVVAFDNDTLWWLRQPSSSPAQWTTTPVASFLSGSEKIASLHSGLMIFGQYPCITLALASRGIFAMQIPLAPMDNLPWDAQQIVAQPLSSHTLADVNGDGAADICGVSETALWWAKNESSYDELWSLDTVKTFAAPFIYCSFQTQAGFGPAHLFTASISPASNRLVIERHRRGVVEGGMGWSNQRFDFALARDTLLSLHAWHFSADNGVDVVMLSQKDDLFYVDYFSGSDEQLMHRQVVLVARPQERVRIALLPYLLKQQGLLVVARELQGMTTVESWRYQPPASVDKRIALTPRSLRGGSTVAVTLQGRRLSAAPAAQSPRPTSGVSVQPAKVTLRY